MTENTQLLLESSSISFPSKFLAFLRRTLKFHKNSLSFRAPFQTHKTSRATHSGFYAEEIAKEFAALLSLVTRRRIFAVRQTRMNGLPIEESAKFYQSSHYQEPQRLKEIYPAEINKLLINLQAMDRRLARSFILASRLYHSAIEMMFTEPEFSYLFLIMSIEAISSVEYENMIPDDKGNGRSELDQFLDSKYSGWRNLCDTSTPERRKAVVKMLLTEEYFTRRKFHKFISKNVPDAFWIETEDDAKPYYLQSVIVADPDNRGRGIEKISHAEKTIREWEKIKREDLKQVLGNIYDARSALVHQGDPFPPTIVIGHFRSIPSAALTSAVETAFTSGQMNTSINFQIPPLLTFERLVSYSMVEFLKNAKIK